MGKSMYVRNEALAKNRKSFVMLNNDFHTQIVSKRVTTFEPTALLAESVQNISIYTVYIDIFCTRSAKRGVGLRGGGGRG